MKNEVMTLTLKNRDIKARVNRRYIISAVITVLWCIAVFIAIGLWYRRELPHQRGVPDCHNRHTGILASPVQDYTRPKLERHGQISGTKGQTTAGNHAVFTARHNLSCS